jgi:hypothetical protein
VGPVKIKKSDLKTSDVLVARLSGAVSGQVATVRDGKKYYFVTSDGKAKEVPADSHTDCLNYAVWEMNRSLGKPGRRKK